MKDIIFIIALIASFLLSVLGTPIFINTENNEMATTIVNPLYEDIENFGNKFELDLGYTKNIKYGSTFNPDQINFINNSHNNYDVIIIGDSSVYMGLSNEVLNQFTNKKVGFFSFPALGVTQSLINFIDLIKQHKLKKNGTLMLMFNHTFWLKGYYSQQENQQMDRLINKPNVFTKPSNCFFCRQRQNLYFDNFTYKLKHFFVLGDISLPYLNFYHPFIEKFIAPIAFKKKKLNAKEKLKGARFLIENNIVFIHQINPTIIKKKKPFQSLPTLLNSDLQLVRDDFANRKIQFGFVVPLTTDDNIRLMLNRIYHSYFSDMPLIDMNGLLPTSWEVDAQNRTHMSNLGSFKQSILLGSWINRYLTEKNSDLNRVFE